MNRTLKAIAAIMLMMVFVAGCNKPDEPNNEGNNDSDVRVTTYTPQDITATTAKCGGDAIVTQGLSLTEIGICWSTSENPTVTDSYTSSSTWNEPFICTIYSLTPGTEYHVRAFGLRGLEYYYGEDKCFTTLEHIGDVPVGAIDGLFSISETQQIYFSKGNLQYQASTNTWRFADKQWSYIGDDNSSISPTYSGWIDLFGWGTSGNSHGAICYQPWSTDINFEGYYAYGQHDYCLCDLSGMADWGFNAIVNGGNQNQQWRTLLKDEWIFLLKTRNTPSGIRFAKARVNEINGLLIIPDYWSFSDYPLIETNKENASYDSNIIDLTTWESVFAAKGVVFLPSGGARIGSQINAPEIHGNEPGIFGGYWSATPRSDVMPGFQAYGLLYNETNIWYCDITDRYVGHSVRLVCDNK
jgi:hypothetical protein